jgi:hypothetical protein
MPEAVVGLPDVLVGTTDTESRLGCQGNTPPGRGMTSAWRPALLGHWPGRGGRIGAAVAVHGPAAPSRTGTRPLERWLT